MRTFSSFFMLFVCCARHLRLFVNSSAWRGFEYARNVLYTQSTHACESLAHVSQKYRPRLRIHECGVCIAAGSSHVAHGAVPWFALHTRHEYSVSSLRMRLAS